MNIRQAWRWFAHQSFARQMWIVCGLAAPVILLV